MLLFIIALLLTGCEAIEEPKAYQEIAGRDGKNTYRVRVPQGWEQKEIKGSLQDSTLPLCEFLVDGSIRLTIHNFPGLKVPPQAQIARWYKQFEEVRSDALTPQAFSGFIGLKWEASGTMQGKEMKVLGWSMQLAPEFAPFAGEQKGADVTIKIVGEHELVARHQAELEQFARSFELIDDL